MKSFTTAGVTRAALALQFYNDVVPMLRQGVAQESSLFQSPVWKSLMGHINFADPKPTDTQYDEDLRVILDETDRRVQQELGENASLFYTAPTRFAVMYFDCHLKHSAAVKREYMGENAPKKLTSFETHDVEGDLAWVAHEAATARMLHFGLYETFANAMIEQRFGDARPLLVALQAVRAMWPEHFQQEMAGWEVNVAAETGDIPMFIKGWNALWKDATVNTELLTLYVQKLFYSVFANGVHVSLNGVGQAEATRNGGYQAFCDAQALEFLKSFFAEIVAELLRAETHDEASFRDMIHTIARQKVDITWRINPYINTISVAWK